MSTQAEVQAHRRARDGIVALAMRDLVAVWRSLTLDDAAQARREIEALLPALFDGYGTPIAALAADWYDELREEARASGAYRATVADPPSAAQVESLAGFATTALYGANPDGAAALSALSGGVQRLLTNADRDTVLRNVAQDPSRVRYARHASANACAFCAMLATRGAVYLSAESAAGVVGRGTEKRNDGSRRDSRRKGIRSRGVQSLGSKYHDHCHCTQVPVFAGQEFEPAPYVKKFEDAYIAATRPQEGPIDLQVTLASMRKTLDSH